MSAEEMTSLPTLRVERRFRGPTGSGNGGWTAGLLARVLPPGAAVEVTLRAPVPLDRDLPVARRAEEYLLLDGDAVVAEARPTGEPPAPVEPVPPEVAGEAMARYAGLRGHPFPECFSCGPSRAVGDGLRIFPGRVPDRPDTVASLWVPDGSLGESGDVADRGLVRVGVPATWAALDCVGGWSEDLEGRPCVLGRITARIDALPVVGEPHVVVGRLLRREGRKSFTASTLYDSDERVVATAAHVWLAVDPASFNRA